MDKIDNVSLRGIGIAILQVEDFVYAVLFETRE